MSVSANPSIRPLNSVARLSKSARFNVAGLAVAAAGMLLQIGAGSTLYPSLAGPFVLLATAAAVAFRPNRWSAYAGLLVPLVLGAGAAVAAVMTGGLIGQLTTLDRPYLVLGSLLHVVGLATALVSGTVMVLGRRGIPRER